MAKTKAAPWSSDAAFPSNRNQTVSFKVLNKDGQPIPLGWIRRALKWDAETENAHWDATTRAFEDGKFDYTFRRQVAECWLRVGAEGYESQVFKFKLSEPDKEITATLKPFTNDQELEK